VSQTYYALCYGPLRWADLMSKKPIIWVKESHEVPTGCFRFGSEHKQKNVLERYGFNKL